jgi:hypothetical protein
VLALHGLDKNGNSMRIVSDTSSDSSNRVLDFEERLGVVEDAISIRVKKNQAGLEKAWDKVTAMDATQSFQDFFREKCATPAQNNPHQQPSDGVPSAPPLSPLSDQVPTVCMSAFRGIFVPLSRRYDLAMKHNNQLISATTILSCFISNRNIEQPKKNDSRCDV